MANSLSAAVLNAANHDSNPAVIAWRADVARRGGKTLLAGYPFAPNKGEAAAIWPDGSRAGGKRFERAPLSVRAIMIGRKTSDSIAIAKGKAAETVTDKVADFGLDNGLLGLLGKVTGIPRGALVVVALLAGAVLGYGALVNIGIAPPMKRLLP